MSRAVNARVVVATLLLVATLVAGMSWIAGHSGAHQPRVVAGGTWCC